jgi:ribonuclease Z
MAQVTFLGVGGALAQAPADNHTALLLRAGASTILFDSGPSIMRQLEQAGIGVDELTHVYLSHQHGDHSLGLPMVLLNRILFWPDLPLTVMAAAGVLEPVLAIVRLAYPDLMPRVESTIRFVSLATEPFSVPLPSDASITYQLASALHSVETWAIRLDLEPDKSVVVSSDTGPVDTIARLASGATLLVHDTYHLDPPSDAPRFHSAAAEVGELAGRAGVQALALVHRLDTRREVASAYRLRAAKVFRGEILVPQAGDSVAL